MYVGILMFGVMPLLILSMWMNNVCATRYRPIYAWSTTKYLPTNSPIRGLEGTYRPLLPFYGNGSVNETMISSDNGKFCMAMYEFSNNPEAYYLTVVMGCNISGAGIPVWVANKYSPCGSDYVLRILDSPPIKGYYYLLYDTTTRCWGSKLGLGVAELTNSGNWVLYDRSTGAFKWQSFDDPTDVLLPGQNLTGGLRLSSRVNSSTPSEGSFSASVVQNRLVLYLRSSNHPQPYFIYSSTSSCASSNENAMVRYQGHSLQLLYDEASGCSPVEIKNFGSTNSDGMNFLRLASDGNLVSYTFAAGNWSLEKFFGSQCDLPNGCGAYGFCTKGNCQCFSTTNSTVEHSTLKASAAGRCSALNVDRAPCDQNLERNNHFVDVQGYTYFSTGYIDGIRISEKSCRSSCLSSCSCSAYVYGNSQCFIIDQVVGSFISSPNMSSYFKFRNNNIRSGSLPSNTKRIKAVVIGLAVVAFVIICLTLAMLKLLKRKPINLVNKEIGKSLARIDGLPPRFTCHEMEVATEGFSKKLGRGGFGSVYKGMLKTGKEVAVKRLEGTSQGAKQFLAEVATMAIIRHVNIVRLCGFCIENNEQMLVYDFMPNGSLDHWLFEDKEPISWEVRVKIAIGMASKKGGTYPTLAGSSPFSSDSKFLLQAKIWFI